MKASHPPQPPKAMKKIVSGFSDCCTQENAVVTETPQDEGWIKNIQEVADWYFISEVALCHPGCLICVFKTRVFLLTVLFLKSIEKLTVMGDLFVKDWLLLCKWNQYASHSAAKVFALFILHFFLIHLLYLQKNYIAAQPSWAWWLYIISWLPAFHQVSLCWAQEEF